MGVFLLLSHLRMDGKEKNMKWVLFTVFLSCPLCGADQFIQMYHCKTPNVADTGYRVLVETGGFVGMTQIKMSA
jgi:hypothetical protein